MAVFRVERTRDYTVMSNYQLRDKNQSLKAKGLLSQKLSLPEDWDYTLAGLSYINRESKDAIRSAVNELEKAGYVQRRQTTDANGKFSVNEYIIHECPVTPAPSLEKPLSENPTTDNPSTGKPLSENPTQINTKKTRKEKQNTDRSNTDSIPSFQQSIPAEPSEANRSEGVSEREYEDYRELICQNIDYDILVAQNPLDVDSIDEIVELMLEVICARRKFTRVAGTDFPHKVVRSRFLKLNSEHIQFVLSCMKENTTRVRNIKQYLLTVLYNAPTTISNYYTALVNHDMNAGG